jgi:hypothetical protein
MTVRGKASAQQVPGTFTLADVLTLDDGVRRSSHLEDFLHVNWALITSRIGPA